ncbi:YagK/YfjJ domain-containing protein [Shewanella gaetbuli]|uniref:Inovirus Gp2 family protein n=1 Tax=Shewanella gaetbuli TaxID=220752 RepID=A0A9X2CMI0_9GAMM|nr:inovirus-type Gp2 protein [Shewanella gaetbuli]MCL1143705.1 inovirus Gp2 family protein [Shewanella gaetbuli]
MSFCITKHNSTLVAYKNHAYNVYKPKSKTLLPRLVTQVIASCETMLSHYSKVFSVRVDLHPQCYSADNKEICQFLTQQVKKLSKRYNCKVKYLCAREQHQSNIQHYHLALMLSGHKIQHPNKILELIQIDWEKLGGKVALVDNPFNVMLRGNKASVKHTIYRLTYLAKKATKELNGTARSLLSNKLQASAVFDDQQDILLVDPNITFRYNSRIQAYRAANKQASPKPIIKAKNAWFITQSHAVQLQQCIAARTTSLTHLSPNAYWGVTKQHSDTHSEYHSHQIDH